MTDGCFFLANSNKVFINLSPSPIYLDVILEAEILKNENFDSLATAFAD